MSNWNINPQAGVDFTATYTVDTAAPEYPGPPFLPGTRMFGTNGSCYIFVKAALAVSRYRVVIVDDVTTWGVRQITNTLARAAFGMPVGVVACPDGIAANSYGWIQVAGYASSAAFNTSSAAFSQAYTDASGVLMSTTAAPGTNAAVDGIVLLSTAAGNFGPAFLNFPTVGAAQ